MKVVFLMLAEIDIGRLGKDQDPAAKAQEILDGFRESSLPSGHGIFLHRIGLKEMPPLNDEGVLFT
jgi:hypothetical protein